MQTPRSVGKRNFINSDLQKNFMGERLPLSGIGFIFRASGSPADAEKLDI
jgi:hypothetical protein